MIKGNESGRSMIEMLGVLAIIGVLSVGGIAGYSKAMTKYRINKTIEQITLIAGNIRSFFKGDYSDLSSTTRLKIIKKAKLVPEEMLTLDSDGNITNITNTLGSEVSVFNGDNSYFAIVTYDITRNQEACIELLSYDWSTIGAFKMDMDGAFFDKLPYQSVEETIAMCSGDDLDWVLLIR